MKNSKYRNNCDVDDFIKGLEEIRRIHNYGYVTFDLILHYITKSTDNKLKDKLVERIMQMELTEEQKEKILEVLKKYANCKG